MTTDVADTTAAPPSGDIAPPETGTQPPSPPAPAAPSDIAPPTPAPTPPPAPPAPEPERLTPEEWQQREQDRQNAQAERDRVQRLKEAKINAPITIRDALDEIQERIGTAIPKELRALILDPVNEALANADEAARLSLSDEYEGDREILKDTTRAFIKHTPEAERGKFAEKVRGQDPDVWVSTFRDVAMAEGAVAARAEFVETLVALLPEGKERDDFTSKAKGPTKTSDIAQAFHDSLVGVVGPKGEPQVMSRGMSQAAPLTTEEARTLPVPELMRRRAAARS